MPRRFLLVITMVAALAGSAEALTIRDVIELSRAGLGDEVLLALIEVDRGVYSIDPATLKKLKAAGVSERVIVALVRSGRELPPDPAPMPVVEDQVPTPQVVVIEHRDEQPQVVERVREVPVAVPVFIPVTRSRHQRTVDVSVDTSNFIPFQSGAPAVRPVQPRKTEPVYWGFGGKLRPDAWDPNPQVAKPHDRRK